MLTVYRASFAYIDQHDIFSNVTFQANPGEIIHLRGSNGCGKSTLLAGMIGLLDLSCEKISWNEQEDLTYFREHSAYLPCERFGIFGALTAESNLQFFLRISKNISSKKVLHEHVTYYLKRWGLSSPYVRDHLQTQHFSTGMKKRLALAKIECMQRSLWLLDEPTQGLDIAGQRLLRKALFAHQNNGGIIIITTHTQDILSDLKHKILDLNP